MRQVPVLDATPFGIVGDGRVARHFLHYLNVLGLSVCAWSRRAPAAAGPTQALEPEGARRGSVPRHHSGFVRAYEQRP